MLARASGRIVNVASTAGLTGYAYVAAYCAAKHGVVGLTRALALEVGDARASRSTRSARAYIETDMLRRARRQHRRKTGAQRGRGARRACCAQPAGPLRCSPKKSRSAVLWLCSPGCDAITGQAIAVSGGEVDVRSAKAVLADAAAKRAIWRRGVDRASITGAAALAAAAALHDAIEAEIAQPAAREFDTTLPRFDLLAQLERQPAGLKMSELSRA